jgi:hypothetical protein
MHTSALLIALALAAPEAAQPDWLTVYGQAQRQGKSVGRPLAVFMAPGKDGWQKLAKDGKFDADALKELAQGYVCVHIDTSTDEGKKMATAFQMPSGVGVVLSSTDGETQAYRNEGTLEASSLSSAIERHSGKTVVRTSNYPAESSVVPGGTVIQRYPIQGGIEPYGSSPRTTRSSYCPT